MNLMVTWTLIKVCFLIGMMVLKCVGAACCHSPGVRMDAVAKGGNPAK